MKTYISGALICCTALLCIATPAQAQLDAWEEVVNNQLAAANEALADEGFALLREPHKGYLENENKERISFTLRAGIAYRILGVCDSDCDDLDLTLYDPKGNKVTEDVAVDDYPLLSITPAESGTYQVEVYMVSCTVSPCYYGIGFWSEEGQVSGSSNKQAESYTGRLESGDTSLPSGEYVDNYSFEARAGQHIVVELRSTDFDTYLMVKSPSGDQTENDDHDGDVNISRVEIDAGESGTWSILATSFEKGETGSYEVIISVSGDGGGGGGTRRESGSLAKGDSRLETGEYYDSYTFEAEVGQTVVVDLRSSEFDTYLGIGSPSEELNENDDWEEGDTTHSRVEVDITESGTWSIVATSYEGEETGSYELTITISGGSAGSSSGGPRIESGELTRGDETIDTGEYVDLYTFEGTAGEQIVLDLRSVNFDTYLIALTPGQERHENDDFEGDVDRSLINLELTESGTYTVGVTSYEAGETGSYDLHILRGSSASASSGPRVERGSLSSGDETLDNGEYLDVFTFEGLPGQHARIDVSSSAFDTYLIVTGPGDFQEDNDDVEGAPGHSIVEFDLTDSGTYTAIITSYAAGETGDYEISISLGAAAQGVTSADNPGQQDIRRLTPGQNLSGRLEPGDSFIETDRYTDIFTFDGQAGQTISVDLTSSDFDTYIGLVFPSEEFLENDDHEGSTNRSRIDLTLQESGRYSVIATSYASGETGSYQVSLTTSSAGPASTSSPSGSGGNVYGLFVGISDYPGEGSDLSFCAEDATTFFSAMQRGAGMPAGNGRVFTDSQATVTNVRNALREFGNQVGPDDVFVFFYSGHGSRVERPGGYEQADPDGIDESIFLYDDQILDNEMATLFDEINARIAILVLDSCFSGGFAKDVISVPNRMGFFSSEEDVTSMVAAKFLAGGYLAKFIADAVGDRLGDIDRDGEINALELSQYLFEQYRAEVKSGVKSDYVSLNSRQLGYQHLIVDRGSIGAYDVVFR
ncbi:pre-peptidase C-terminal domain-containing protein [Gemmatimonadota bacterium]